MAPRRPLITAVGHAGEHKRDVPADGHRDPSRIVAPVMSRALERNQRLSPRRQGVAAGSAALLQQRVPAFGARSSGSRACCVGSAVPEPVVNGALPAVAGGDPREPAEGGGASVKAAVAGNSTRPNISVALAMRQIEFRRLREARQVGHADDRLVLVAADERENLAVVGGRTQAPPAERRCRLRSVISRSSTTAATPGWPAGLDVDCLVVVLGITIGKQAWRLACEKPALRSPVHCIGVRTPFRSPR